MIIVTGAAGFIGSNFVRKLNNEGFRDIIIVDDFSDPVKNKNIEGKAYAEKIHRNQFIKWIDAHHRFIQIIIHLGARTDTAEFDKNIFDQLNLNYSKDIFTRCVKYGLPLIYASSAATYGMGEHGFVDDHDVIKELKPLNAYGESKNEFDKWVIAQEKTPGFWAGFKFFNVYGPNEYHKERMASVVFHAFNQIKKTGKLKLFRSHHQNYEDGKQLRDFIYVKDVVNVLYFFLQRRKNPGIYNLGTGKARTFHDLAKATFKAMNKKEIIEFIDTPKDIRDKYQYFTEANMNKLKQAGYKKPFLSLEQGVDDYVKTYLKKNSFN
jgi:ADP-L-glycero-D-manno-heptose 6-epimerase